MKHQLVRTLVAASLLAAFVTAGSVAAAEPQASARMEKAKDYIADEQWGRAIDLLKAAAADVKEKHRDEALFWLAHSQNQSRDLRGALATIAELEATYPRSRWTKPAGSLRVELAQRLRHTDVLWWTATTEPTPRQMPAMTPVPTTRPGAPVPPHPGERPHALPPTTVTTTPVPRPRFVRPTPAPSTTWVTQNTVADTNLRVQALGILITTDAARVIPMLREIAMESRNPGEASRAVFVLAQSGKPEAHMAVLELARTASEPVSIAAVREFGRFGGKTVSRELLKVYESAKPSVKFQVVNALGERSAAPALLQIAESEPDTHLRTAAIVTLGQAGGRQQLQRLYGRVATSLKRPIIVGLFNARAEDELIRLAEEERDALIRNEILAHLQVLGTPKAKAYLEKVRVKR